MSTAGSQDVTDFEGNLPAVELSAVELTEREIEVINLGNLDLPEGEIVVSDPAAYPDHPRLARRVTPGNYPITIFKAQSAIAMAMVRFADGKVNRWELAITSEQETDGQSSDTLTGYGVDAGLAGFSSPAAQKAIMDFDSNREKHQFIDDVLAKLRESKAKSLLERPLGDNPANIAIFQSGFGDGVYPVFWGLDQNDRPLVVVTDFFVMENADGRDEDRKRHLSIVAAMSPEQLQDNNEASVALKNGDVAKLRSLLAAGRIGPYEYMVDTERSAVFGAIVLDKPTILELLIEYGASASEKPKEHFLSNYDTYPDYVQWLTAQRLGATGPNSLPPLSRELLEVVSRWKEKKL